MELPDRKYVGAFLAGTLWGVVLMFIVGVVYLRHSLIVEMECKGDIDSTVAKIRENAVRLPSWSVQQMACAVPQTPDGSKVAGLRLCNSDYAREIVEAPSDRKFSCAIPCALSIYQKPDGKTYLARINMPLLARLIGGAPAQVFPEKVAPEQRFLLSGVLKP